MEIKNTSAVFMWERNEGIYQLMFLEKEVKKGEKNKSYIPATNPLHDKIDLLQKIDLEIPEVNIVFFQLSYNEIESKEIENEFSVVFHKEVSKIWKTTGVKLNLLELSVEDIKEKLKKISSEICKR